jgi:hypothetical protein
MHLQVQESGNPDGVHQAKFLSITPNPKQKPEYQPSLVLRFQVLPGRPHAGTVLQGFTAAKLTTENKTGRWASGMLGRPLQPNESIDFAALIGQDFVVVIQGGKLQSINRLPQPA